MQNFTFQKQWQKSLSKGTLLYAVHTGIKVLRQIINQNTKPNYVFSFNFLKNDLNLFQIKVVAPFPRKHVGVI